MLKDFNPAKNQIFRVIDNFGEVINKNYFPDLNPDTILKAYKDMLFARIADFMAVSFQRQGRMFTFPPNYGQEAVSQSMALTWNEDDWFVPAFRELGAWLAKGASMKEVFLYFMGYEDGTVFKNAKNIMPISVPIGSQLLHAAGIGYGINYNKTKQVVMLLLVMVVHPPEIFMKH